MKIAVLGVLAGLLASIAGPALADDRCDVAGSEALLASPSTKYILVGETHGTQEGPAIFGDLVCALAKSGRKIVVGVEFPAAAQFTIDQFLASDGGPDAVQQLLAQLPWDSGFKDGKTSKAMLALMVRLRSMYQARAIAGVRYLVEPTSGGGDPVYNQAIADGMARAQGSVPDSVVVALVGSVHATKQELAFDGPRFKPAAMLLPGDQALSLFLQSERGRAWNCENSICAPRFAGVEIHLARGVHMRLGGLGADGLLTTDLPATASPPA
jgi:hypothetical protein